MIDIEKFEENYNDFKKAIKCLRIIKKKKNSFYRENMESLSLYKDVYYELDTDEQKREYLENNKKLRLFFTYEYMNNYMDKIVKEITSDRSFIKQKGRIISIEKENEIIRFLDLETEDELNVESFNESKIRYLIACLKSSDSYIGSIPLSSLSLMRNIIYDIKCTGLYYTNEGIYKEYEQAFRFNGSKGKINSKIDLDKEYKKITDSYSKGEISLEEFKVRFYMIKILKDRDIDYMLINVSEEDKEVVLKAYEKLSSLNMRNEFNIHIRSSQPLVNAMLYQRRRKKENE